MIPHQSRTAELRRLRWSEGAAAAFGTSGLHICGWNTSRSGSGSVRLDPEVNVLPCVILLQLLEENIFNFVKNELKMIQRSLSYDYPECPEIQEEEELQGNREAFLNITVNFLKRMKQEELADRLQRGEEMPPNILCIFKFLFVLF